MPPDVPRYEILGELGRGAMGVVYKVRDRQLNRIVAIKVSLAGEIQDESGLTTRFIAEAQVAAQLEHPSITPIYDLDYLPDGRPYFTMRLIEGKSLAEHLAQTPGAAMREKCRTIAEGLAEALAHVHSRGIVHRDLKPANVMVGETSEVSIVDLGLVKVLQGFSIATRPPVHSSSRVHTDCGETQYGDIMGTFAFMPPEQAIGEVDQVGPHSDVFAFGAILCQMLTGQPPYTGATIEDVRRRAVQGDLSDAHQRLVSCGGDAELVQLALRCLNAEPSNRPADGAEIAQMLAAKRRAKEPEANLQSAEQGRLSGWASTLWRCAAAAVALALSWFGTRPHSEPDA